MNQRQTVTRGKAIIDDTIGTQLKEMKRLYTVVKNQDLIDYLHPEMLDTLQNLLDKVEINKRLNEGKADNKYIVVNTDEPYVGEIIEVLKRNGHWG